MQLSNIYSIRKTNSEVYSDLIYEWEDDLSKSLNISITSYSSRKVRIIRGIFRLLRYLKLNDVFQRLDSLRSPKLLTFVYEIRPRSSFSFQVFSNKVPYIIDFDLDVNLEVFYSVYKNCKIILISSLEAFLYLKNKNCPLNIAHLPLSISDRHVIDLYSLNNKEFDVIVARSDKVFMEYLKKFSEEHPNFEYVVRTWAGNQLYKNNVYISNKRGILGEFSDRKSYFSLLKKAKVALYATPGFDENSKRFMHHITPSLFEFVSSGCRIIARYPQNAEIEQFNLKELSQSIETYDQFRKALTLLLEDKSSHYLKVSQDFLQKITTTNQIANLKSILKNNIK